MLRIATAVKVRIDQLQQQLARRAGPGEEGAGAVEYILITLGGIALVGIIIVALRAFATAQAGNLRSPL